MGWPVAAVVVGALSVTAPVAVPLAVSAIGFGSAGIASGSLASSIMAGYGGFVAKGSMCAVLQSVGATGSIGGGTAVASLGGALTATGIGFSAKLRDGTVSAASSVVRTSGSALIKLGGVSASALSTLGGASCSAACTVGGLSLSLLGNMGGLVMAGTRGIGKSVP